MNTFLLPIAAVLALLFLARRLVRHRETLHERLDRLSRVREHEHKDITRLNAAMAAAEALAPLRLALHDLLEEAGFAVNVPDGVPANLPTARLTAQGDALEVEARATSHGDEPVRFCIRWVRRESHFSALQQGREVRRGHFVLALPGHDDERHNDLAELERRCAALIKGQAKPQAAPTHAAP